MEKSHIACQQLLVTYCLCHQLTGLLNLVNVTKQNLQHKNFWKLFTYETF